MHIYLIEVNAVVLAIVTRVSCRISPFWGGGELKDFGAGGVA